MNIWRIHKNRGEREGYPYILHKTTTAKLPNGFFEPSVRTLVSLTYQEPSWSQDI